MHQIDPIATENYILDLAKKFSALSDVTIDSKMYRDLGIDREDAVEFYNNLETKFQVDLSPITEVIIDAPARWFRKAQPRVVPRDPSLREILMLALDKSKQG